MVTPQRSLNMLQTPQSQRGVPNTPGQSPNKNMQVPLQQQPQLGFNQDSQQNKEPEQTKEQPKKSLGQLSTPDTYQGEPDPTADETSFGYWARQVAQTASRGVEQGLGFYGNFEKTVKGFLKSAPASGGILGYAISELVGKDKWEKMVEGKGQIATTSEQIKEGIGKATGGYTLPKTPGEKKAQGVIEDVASTLRGGRPTNVRNVLVNNLGIPFASNAVKEVVEHLGFGEDKGTIAKLGAWVALSLAGNINGAQYASQLTNQGRQAMPQNLQSNIPRLQQRLQVVANDPHLLHSDPRTALARQELNSIQTDLANGQTSVRSLMTMYDGINAAKRNRGLFELNRGDQNFARRSIDKVRNAVRDEIMAAGAGHQQALDHWRSGIQAWAVIHQSRSITNWIDNLVRGPYGKAIGGPAAALFGVGGGVNALKAPIVAGPTAAAVPAIYKAGQVAYRVYQDPNLSRYYWHAIADAAQENLPAFINNYQKLNKGIEKSVPVVTPIKKTSK